jgi:haloacetate dehalogenase
MNGNIDALFPGFRSQDIATSGATIRCVIGGSGPPLLLLHGYPQTHAMWTSPRLVAERLSVALGQQVIVENRPGAGGVVGSEIVAKARRTATR